MSSFEEVRRHVLGAPHHFAGPSSAEQERARLACMNLHYACFALTDFGQALASLPLFAPDYTGVTNGVVMDHAGKHEALRKRQENTSRRTRHICSNYLFRLAAPDVAYGMSIVTVFLEDDQAQVGVTPLTVADCGEKYVRNAAGGWQIQYRYLQSVAGAPR